jgi:AcrR family transcriptional regulator
MTGSTNVRGRPRSEASKEAILAAAFDVLAERGYAGMSFEAVAARAGAGKTTIYRWWNTKAELAVAAFFHGTQDELMLPDTGSTREDFRLQITQLADLLRGTRGAVFAAMLGGARTAPGLAQALNEQWREPRRLWGNARMARAVAAGECRPNLNIRAALGILYGPLYTPLLFGQDIPSVPEVEAHLNLALAMIFNDP